jgi:phytoene desaturase
MKKNIHIIGSGFSALSASCYLAKEGYNVTILEKNDTLGGRARQYKKEGFTFDIGPSWYWMPDVFERFFADFGKKPSDYYTLDKLHPGYEVYFGENSSLKISSHLEEIYNLFEKEEKGSAKHLKSFIDSAKSNYETAIKDLVYKPGVSPLELINTTTISRVSQFFSTIRKQVRKNIKKKN